MDFIQNQIVRLYTECGTIWKASKIKCITLKLDNFTIIAGCQDSGKNTISTLVSCDKDGNELFDDNDAVETKFKSRKERKEVTLHICSFFLNNKIMTICILYIE